MESKEFRTNAYLTLITEVLMVNETKGEDARDILKESLDIISYVFEDIPQEKTKGYNYHKTCKNHLLSLTDPSIIEYAKQVNNHNYYDIVKNTNKLLGDYIFIPKIPESSIDHINQFQKRKNVKNTSTI